jgi:cytochrome c
MIRCNPLARCLAPPVTALAMTWLSAAPAAHAAPDIELGRYLANQCLTCHRAGGSPAAAGTGAIPNIFGMAEPRFATLVKAYRAKQLPNEVMQNAVGNLKDDEIEALAAYFARTTRP